jgi:two-component system alkaline phosphatase synthesis response regulator PhoP
MAETEYMKKILVVDDDLDILDLMRIMLSMHGFIVETVSRWELIDQAIEQAQPDLIILDISLNGADGRDICRKLKSEPSTSRTPIILFSANQEMGKESQACGAHTFISKPFEFSYLVQTVQRVLSLQTPMSDQLNSVS